MSLNKTKLTNDLVAMMNAAMSTDGWTKEQTAQAMADAIDAFVRGGAVKGVKVVDGDRTLAQTGEVALA